MKNFKLLSIIPTVFLGLICLCAATKNSNEPIIAGLLFTPAPLSQTVSSPIQYSHSQGYEESLTVHSAPQVEAAITEVVTASVSKGDFDHAIREMTILSGTHETADSKVRYSNRTDYDININDYIGKGLYFELASSSEPQVLIVHTHATEAYLSEEAEGVNGSSARRSTDTNENMVTVGERLISVLEAGGIHCLHDTSLHDHPNYKGSYDRAAESIRSYLDKYPSIKVVFDLHRDAVWNDDGTRIKPTVIVNGKKAAQIMIISGTDKGGLTFDSWKSNLRFAATLQQQTDALYPNLLRPLNIAAARYNMHLTTGSLLFEFGSDVNTLDEALYSAELMGNALLSVLK